MLIQINQSSCFQFYSTCLPPKYLVNSRPEPSPRFSNTNLLASFVGFSSIGFSFLWPAKLGNVNQCCAFQNFVAFSCVLISVPFFLSSGVYGFIILLSSRMVQEGVKRNMYLNLPCLTGNLYLPLVSFLLAHYMLSTLQPY